MSAPNQGRQSPEPENQTDLQNGTQAGDPNGQNAAPKGGAAEKSKQQLDNLSSNPKGPLEDAAKDKVSKD